MVRSPQLNTLEHHSLQWNLIGLLFAFPKTTKAELAKDNRVETLYNAVKGRPKIKEYMESDRRQPFGQGIFRHYPELEEDA
jgi:glutathione S-transferase